MTSGGTTKTGETQRIEPNLTRSPSRTDTTQAASLPETLSYRIKRVLLGPPLVSEQLGGQRLGKPTALAVLSSDVMSSSAYATEQMLRTLILVGGLAAFSLITPLTAAILAVLAVVTICYRDVVRSYPKAGGSYVVSRDNFGPNVAQIAGAALLISYTITVAVSVAAGADAIGSAAPVLKHAAVPMSIGFVVLLAFGNLRGIREAGRVFAVPTYFFIANMAVLIVMGLVRAIVGNLGHVPRATGTLPLGHAGGGLLLGISAFYMLRAFANGSSAMTGTEAISNAVSIFSEPQAKNARTTLVLMSSILGAMFLGVSVLAAFSHPVPYTSGLPTVLSEIGRLVYGSSPGGEILFYALQAATALILILAANTSFTGFPFLVSFVAEDSFLPRKLTVRGHRLVFSNGILVLAAASIALLVATEAQGRARSSPCTPSPCSPASPWRAPGWPSTTGPTATPTGARAWPSTGSPRWCASSSSSCSPWPSSPRVPGWSWSSCPSSCTRSRGRTTSTASKTWCSKKASRSRRARPRSCAVTSWSSSSTGSTSPRHGPSSTPAP